MQNISCKKFCVEPGILALTRVEFCSPKCRTFKCGKNAAIFQQNRVWCRVTEEDCVISTCNFATCFKRRLLSRGICGETVKRKTTEKEPEDALGPEIRLKGKTLRKIGDKEIF